MSTSHRLALYLTVTICLTIALAVMLVLSISVTSLDIAHVYFSESQKVQFIDASGHSVDQDVMYITVSVR